MNAARWSLGVVTALIIVAASVTVAAEGEPAVAAPRMGAFQPSAPLQGRLAAAGTTEMGSMMEGWALLLHQAQPGVTVRVEAKGPPTAPAGLTSGTAQLGFIGRTLKEPELAAFVARYGYPPLQFRVAAGAYSDFNKTSTMAVFVHRDNPISRLSLAQVDAIFSATRRRGRARAIATWGDLGLIGDWEGRPVHAYTGQFGQGRLNFVRETVLLDSEWSAAIRQLPHDADVVAAVSNDSSGISVASLANGTDGVRAVALALVDNSPAYAPTLENVSQERYPLSRVVYININAAPGQPIEPLTKEFMRVVLSHEGQEVVKREGFLPLPDEIVAEELRKLK